MRRDSPRRGWGRAAAIDLRSADPRPFHRHDGFATQSRTFFRNASPMRCGKKFEIALQIHRVDEKDVDRLIANRWQLLDPIRAAGCPDAFRRYVQNSGAEFSVAQNIYVETNSGWFSDRTVQYLASGKPVLVQDTGFGGNVPTGEGLVTFRTLDEAIEG